MERTHRGHREWTHRSTRGQDGREDEFVKRFYSLFKVNYRKQEMVINRVEE